MIRNSEFARRSFSRFRVATVATLSAILVVLCNCNFATEPTFRSYAFVLQQDSMDVFGDATGSRECDYYCHHRIA